MSKNGNFKFLLGKMRPNETQNSQFESGSKTFQICLIWILDSFMINTNPRQANMGHKKIRQHFRRLLLYAVAEEDVIKNLHQSLKRWFRILDPRFGKEKSGSWINIPHHISKNLVTIQCCGSGIMFASDLDPVLRTSIRDPGQKNPNPRSGTNIPDHIPKAQ